VGRFGRPHGIKGLITVHAFTEPRDNILQYPDWHMLIKGSAQSLKINHIESNNKHILASVSGYDTRETVALLTNVDIVVDKKHLPALADDEFYWHELIGMQVTNKAGVDLGLVTEILETGTNDVLVVEGVKKHLIPYLPDRHVISIDKIQSRILVDWDEDF
jgi:16S rRNA processing protein RimM